MEALLNHQGHSLELSLLALALQLKEALRFSVLLLPNQLQVDPYSEVAVNSNNLEVDLCLVVNQPKLNHKGPVSLDSQLVLLH